MACQDLLVKIDFLRLGCYYSKKKFDFMSRNFLLVNMYQTLNIIILVPGIRIFFTFNDQLNYALAHYFKEFEIIKGNVYRF